ncbi:hypothetical protein TIFTF001_034283 [Ficus carica]|uniref:Uncharacterized protein n=1 Tax=Ficus carica TaxID=3494 RepID=A0AA88J8B7_FICCA|nr:hypothetical protein TIFTF001_034283 [Ficus carica]
MDNGDVKITINSLFLEQDWSPVGNYDNGEMELESLPKAGHNKEHGMGIL